MRRIFVFSPLVLVAAVLLTLAGCKKDSSNPYGSSTPTAPTMNTTASVAIANFAFSPSSITVAKGTSITWHNSDSAPHTATADNGAWDTGTITQGASKSITFNTPGTYPYHCSVHPMMKATVVVQ